MQTMQTMQENSKLLSLHLKLLYFQHANMRDEWKSEIHAIEKAYHATVLKKLQDVMTNL